MSTSVTLTKSRLKRTSNGTATYTPVRRRLHWRKILEEEFVAVIAERRAYEGATATLWGLVLSVASYYTKGALVQTLHNDQRNLVSTPQTPARVISVRTATFHDLLMV